MLNEGPPPGGPSRIAGQPSSVRLAGSEVESKADQEFVGTKAVFHQAQ
jgi:hypothetical protein